MKPSRGKRRGPQSPSVGFSSPASRRARCRHPQGVRRVRSAGRRVHFRRTERHDRFAGGQKPPEKVTDPSWVGVTAPDGVGPSADRGRPLLRGRRRLRRSGRPFDLRGLSSVPADCGRSASSVGRRRLGVGGESVGHLSDPS